MWIYTQQYTKLDLIPEYTAMWIMTILIIKSRGILSIKPTSIAFFCLAITVMNKALEIQNDTADHHEPYMSSTRLLVQQTHTHTRKVISFSTPGIWGKKKRWVIPYLFPKSCTSMGLFYTSVEIRIIPKTLPPVWTFQLLSTITIVQMEQVIFRSFTTHNSLQLDSLL